MKSRYMLSMAALVASLSLVACGDDSSSTSVVSVDNPQELGNQDSGKSSSSIASKSDEPSEPKSSSSSAIADEPVGSSASGDFVCDVQETATTVVVTQILKGWGSYKETGTLRDGNIYFVQEYEFETNTKAAEECVNFVEEAASWTDGSVQVNCDGRRVVREDFSETDDIAGYAADQRESCVELIEEYNSGMMLDDEDDEW